MLKLDRVWIPVLVVSASATAAMFDTTPLLTDPGGGQTVLEPGAADLGANWTMGARVNTVFYVGGGITEWAGSDIGAQINDAYSKMPETGGKIVVLPSPSGDCYQQTTPIVLATLGKYVTLEGQSIGSTRSDAGVTDRGVCLNFTSTVGTAITLDYGTAGGAYIPDLALDNLILTNNACTTLGGCHYPTIGVLSGPDGHNGISHPIYRNLKISGFGTGIDFTELAGFGWPAELKNVSVLYCGVGLTVGTVRENLHWFGGTIAKNTVGVEIGRNLGDYTFYSVSFESNLQAAVVSHGSIFTFMGCRWENAEASSARYIEVDNSTVAVLGGFMVDNNKNHSEIPQHILADDSAFVIDGLNVYSAGETVTQLVSNPNGGVGKVQFFTSSPDAYKKACSVPQGCIALRLANGEDPIPALRAYLPAP
jgi:hypothetical protein